MSGLRLEIRRVEQAQLPRRPIDKVRPLVNRGTERIIVLRGTKIALECLDKFRRLAVNVEIPNEIQNFLSGFSGDSSDMEEEEVEEDE